MQSSQPKITDGPSGRIWTRRHYYPYLWGALFGAVYAIGLRWGAAELHIELPGWVVPITAQAALWGGVFFARLALFD